MTNISKEKEELLETLKPELQVNEEIQEEPDEELKETSDEQSVIPMQEVTEYQKISCRDKIPWKKAGIILLIILGFPIWGTIGIAGIVVVAVAILTIVILLISTAIIVYFLTWCLPVITLIISAACMVTMIVGVIGSIIMIFGGIFAEELSAYSFGIIQFGLSIVLLGITILSGIATLYILRFSIYFSLWFGKKYMKLSRGIYSKCRGLFRMKSREAR